MLYWLEIHIFYFTLKILRIEHKITFFREEGGGGNLRIPNKFEPQIWGWGN